MPESAKNFKKKSSPPNGPQTEMSRRRPSLECIRSERYPAKGVSGVRIMEGRPTKRPACAGGMATMLVRKKI